MSAETKAMKQALRLKIEKREHDIERETQRIFEYVADLREMVEKGNFNVLPVSHWAEGRVSRDVAFISADLQALAILYEALETIESNERGG